MGFAVDTKHLLNEVIPRYEESFNETISYAERSRGRRLQLHRVCVYAIVTHDFAARKHFHYSCGIGDPKQKAALHWQAEQGDDEDEVEVLHHLKQLAATTTAPGVRSARPGSGGVESRAGTTTLVASVQSPTFTSCTQHRPPSSFRRFSSRHIVDTTFQNSGPEYYSLSWDTNSWKCDAFFRHGSSSNHSGTPRIVFTAAEARCYSVIWLLQFDFLDFSGQSSSSPSGARKRRRTLNPFHHVSPTHDGDHTPPAQDRPALDVKRFKGVRFRTDHKRWVAEMKPPKSKNKVSFGEFRSQTHAARVVDVAFHYYGKPLNFPDSTPRILPALAPSTGLSAEAKLKFVKDQTKRMKSRVSSLPSSRDPSTSDTNSGLRSFSAIGSSLILVGSDEADDAVSQPQSGWVQAPMSSAGMGEGQETCDVANGSGEGPQSGTRQWSVETGMAHDPSDVFGISPEQLDGALTTGARSQPMDCGGSMMVGFPAAPSVFPTGSWGEFRMEAADDFWEPEIAVIGRDWAGQFQRDGHGWTSDDDAASKF